VYITLTNGPKPVEGGSVVISRLTRFSGEQTFDLPASADRARRQGGGCTISTYDVVQSNGDIHMVDKVLLPS